jgi:DNA replication and repair protein RecF
MVTDIRLQHFRSYTDASFEIGPSVNIIVGPNASGKTNLLEAVLVLARGSSYRAKDAELVQFGKDWARLDADLPGSTRIVKFTSAGPVGPSAPPVLTSFRARGAAPRAATRSESVSKQFEIDEQQLSRLSHTRSLPVVLFEPNHLLLLSSSPELRRNFLDDLIEQTEAGFGATRRHYKRVLSQRNALLKKNPRDLRQQLFVWNVRLSELGGKIARERTALIDRFAEKISDLYGALAQQNDIITLSYNSPFPPTAYETALLQKLEVSQELDVLRGFTAYGPHRDDLSVELGGHSVQTNASRGETRTLVLALKILELHHLEAARGQKPLLLLDDVFSELDGKRRQALTGFVRDYQTFITTTDADMVVQHFTTSNIIPVTAPATRA